MLKAILAVLLIGIVIVEGAWTYQQSDISHISDTDMRIAFDEHINRVKAGESLADMCDDARQALRLIERFKNKTKAEWSYQNTLEIAVKSSECN